MDNLSQVLSYHTFLFPMVERKIKEKLLLLLSFVRL